MDPVSVATVAPRATVVKLWPLRFGEMNQGEHRLPRRLFRGRRAIGGADGQLLFASTSRSAIHLPADDAFNRQE
jgi:hypothetical protein